jgi:hypothetical protein
MNWLFHSSICSNNIYLSGNQQIILCTLLYLIVSFLATAIVFLRLAYRCIAANHLICRSYHRSVFICSNDAESGEETATRKKLVASPCMDWPIIVSCDFSAIIVYIWSAKTQPAPSHPFLLKPFLKIFQSYVWR